MNQVHGNPDTREAMSAGLDGELPASELRFLLRRMDHDVGLRQTWTRYHVIGDSLRKDLAPLASAGFAERVYAGIEGEAVPVAAKHRHWLRWTAGGAIAASVAAVTLMVGQPGNDAPQVAQVQETTQDSAAPSTDLRATAATVPSAVPPWLSADAAGALSQQASATFGAPFAVGAIRQAPWAVGPGYASPVFYRRTPANRDGSYLLLVEPVSAGEAVAPRDTAVIAR